MKKTLRFISTFLCVVLLFVSVPITTSAALPEEKDRNEVDIEEYNHSLSYLMQVTGYSIDELYHEEVDNVDYIYTVNNGEAVLLNVHIQYRGPEKIVLTLPTVLGGYPVTTIGSNTALDVFWFIEYDENIDWEYYFEEGFPWESDIGLDYVSKIVIPEGYEVIENWSLSGFYCYEFPKSLKIIRGRPFDFLYTNFEKRSVVLPESDYIDYNYNFLYGIDMLDFIVAPSRDTIFSEWIFEYNFNSCLFYLPSNLSYENIRSHFFGRYDSSWYPEYGEWQGTLNFACAPDSEWLKVFEDYPGYNINVTYVEPATHIAFDSENISVEVGEVVDLEAKTYPSEAVWTACDYVSSNPEVVKVDPYSGRITALAEGEATITATHVERGFVDTCTVKVENKPEHICTPAEKWSADETAHWLECTDPECGEIINYAEHSGGNATVNAKAVCEHCGTAYGEYVAASFSVEPVSDIAYCAREKREYKITVAENADKVQFIRDSGSTTTFVRSQAAEIINNGDGTETWILAVSLNKGKYTLATKYGKVWNKNGIEFEIVFDTPKCRSFTSEKVGNLTTFTVVTDPQVAKIQLITQSGNTLTYTQSNSYIGEDGLRYWTVVRKITKPGTIGLRTKYGYTWTTTDFTIEV